jgi:segregation and condensation protein A
VVPRPESATAEVGAGETVLAGPEVSPGFEVRLENFSGPFDLLLSLITKREMDITEVALSAVTDEFLSFLRRIDTDENLDQASEFIVVAATLLDLKVAGLLPQGELVDAEDVALLEARDLLFARLLQYRAFKQAAEWFAQHGTPARCDSSRSTASRPPSSSGRSRPTTSPPSPPWR